MRFRPGLLKTGPLIVGEVRRHAEQAGFLVFVLPSGGIKDRAGFFEAVRSTFPLDPPLLGSISWEALGDSLWEGLLNCSSRRIAVIWQGAKLMQMAAPHDFAIAISVLADVARLLADPRATVGVTKEVAILVDVLPEN